MRREMRYNNADLKGGSNPEETMAQKNKISFTVRIDEELYKKMLAVAAAEGRDENNHLLHLIRTNIQYYERVHGRVDTSNVTLPEHGTDSGGEAK